MVSDLPARTRRTLDPRQLLELVADHLAVEGVHAFTLRKAAAAADTTHKVLLYHFESSEQLLVQALDVLRERATAHGTAIIMSREPDQPAWSKLPELWTWWIKDRSVRVLVQGIGLAMADPEHFGEFGRRATHQLLEPISALVADASPAIDPDVIATLVLAVMRGLSMDRVTTDDTDRADAALDYAVLMLIGMIQAPAA